MNERPARAANRRCDEMSNDAVEQAGFIGTGAAAFRLRCSRERVRKLCDEGVLAFCWSACGRLIAIEDFKRLAAELAVATDRALQTHLTVGFRRSDQLPATREYLANVAKHGRYIPPPA